MTQPLQQQVAASADAAELHATVPALLIELQTHLGALSATATAATERGRRPFRPPADWATRLGDLAYGIYLLADQSGVDVSAEVQRTVEQVRRQGEAARDEQGWPFTAG